MFCSKCGKIFLALLLTFSTLLSMVACANSNDTDTTKNDNETSSFSNEQNTTAPDNEQNAPQEQFKEHEVLFYTRDRADDVGDTYTVYAYNYKGELLYSKHQDDLSFIGPFAECGLTPATSPQTEKKGYVDKSGVFQVEPKYDQAYPFSDSGIALVAIKVEKSDSYNSKYRYGYINTKGEEITPCIYDNATSFYPNGYALASVEEWKQTTIKGRFDYDIPAKECIAETQYVIDEKGKEIAKVDVKKENRYVEIWKDSYIYCSLDGNSIFNSSGQKISAEELLNSTDQSYQITTKQVATTQSGLACGIEKNGEVLIPFAYDFIEVCGNYFIAGKYGPNNYEHIFDIYDQNYIKTVENISYIPSTSLKPSYYGDDFFPNGFFKITFIDENNDWLNGVIDYTGNMIVPPVFEKPIQICTYESLGQFVWSSSLGHVLAD